MFALTVCSQAHTVRLVMLARVGSLHFTFFHSHTPTCQTHAHVIRYKIANQSPHFVRCIKPNHRKEPRSFDTEIVRGQIRCTGVLATVRIRRDGYSVRLTFAEFLQAYQIVRFPATEPVPAKDAKDACGEVLKWAATRRALPEDSWQLGKSKVVAHPPSLSLSQSHFLLIVLGCFSPTAAPPLRSHAVL
jgi:hypothetical protein